MVESAEDHGFKAFIDYHAVQLFGIGFPKELEKQLYKKLNDDNFDAGQFMKIMINEEEDTVQLTPSSDMPKDSHVFLIDHAWTFKQSTMYKTLAENVKLSDRMKGLMKFSNKRDLPGSTELPKPKVPLEERLKEIPEQLIVDLDDYGLTSLDGVQLNDNVEQISLFNNPIDDLKKLLEKIYGLKNLKALWLNGTPIHENCLNLSNVLETMFPNLQIINSKFAMGGEDWAIKYYANNAKTLEEIEYLDLSGRGVLGMKDFEPFGKMPNLRTLDIRDHPEFTKETIRLNDINSLLRAIPQVEHLYLDDEIEEQLWKNYDNGDLNVILPNLKSINGIYLKYGKPKDVEIEANIRYVLKHAWKYANSYRLATSEQIDEESLWYVMDEVGSAIQHSDVPNLEVHPFLFSRENDFKKSCMTFSIMWPKTDLKENDILYRDFLQGITEKEFRSARLSVWFHIPLDYFETQRNVFEEILKKAADGDETVYKNYAENKAENKAVKPVSLPHSDSPLKVFSDLDYVKDNLTSKNFQVVQEIEEADIVWVAQDVYNKAYNLYNINEKQLVSQFPYESCIVMKHSLTNTIQSTYGETKYYQKSYILNDHLPAFIGEHIKRQQLGKNNIWILKPINMARSMDTIVTDNCDQIIRTMETGPKICQKYIENTLLYEEKYKYDLRFIVVLKSLIPLEIYLYNDFWIRVSNDEYSLDSRSFTSYDTHFTVMNYGDKKMKTVKFPEFIETFNKQYESQGVQWPAMIEKIKHAVAEVFIAAQFKYPEMQNDKARSIYGLDLMIDSSFNPKILEFTFSPDCTRACNFNPDFFNDIFEALFLEDKVKNMTKI